jgi:diacylglycerol kinase
MVLQGIRLIVCAMLCYLAYQDTHSVAVLSLFIILCLHTETLNSFCLSIGKALKRVSSLLDGSKEAAKDGK